MKKYIIGVLIGVLLTLTTTVVALNLTAETTAFEPDDETWDVATVEEALNDLYTEVSDYNMEAVTYNSAGGGEVYGIIELPDLTKYNTLSIGNVSLEAGTFQYLRLLNPNGEEIHSFSLTSQTQSVDVSEMSGSGYMIAVYARNMGTYKAMTLYDIKLTK